MRAPGANDLLVFGLKAGIVCYDVVQSVPPLRCIAGVLADTILGPAEEIDYVSKTAPAAPPTGV